MVCEDNFQAFKISKDGVARLQENARALKCRIQIPNSGPRVLQLLNNTISNGQTM